MPPAPPAGDGGCLLAGGEPGLPAPRPSPGPVARAGLAVSPLHGRPVPGPLSPQGPPGGRGGPSVYRAGLATPPSTSSHPRSRSSSVVVLSCPPVYPQPNRARIPRPWAVATGPLTWYIITPAPPAVRLPPQPPPAMKRALAFLRVSAPPVTAAAPSAEQVTFFEARVRPLLVQHCQSCHGPKKQQGGLRLDSASALQAGGDTGPVVVPGKPERSLLVRAVRHLGPKMPPTAPLPAADVATLVEWVKAGAAWPADTAALRKRGTVTDADRAFWSFRPVRDPAVPVVKNTAWALTPLDRFLLEKLEAKGLTPARPADRRTLLRRATYD